MKEKFKTAAAVITAVLIAAFFTGCQQDDEVVVTGGATVSSAKEWFKEYEGKGDNYVYLQNLIYDWPGAIVKQAEDGTEVIVIPIKELKKDQSEIWQQRLYLYKLPDGSYKASVVEIYPDKAAPQEDQSMEGGNFNGYISVWDLKKGFVKAAQFKDNHAVEDGIVEVLDREDKTTYRAPSLNPCADGSCNDGAGGGNPTPVPRILPTELREVVKINSYTGPKPKLGTPVAYYGPRSPVIGGTTPGGYTSPVGGNGGGGSAPRPAAANPCDKMKALTDITKAGNMKPGIDWLKGKVMAPKNDIEHGVEVKKVMNPDETFRYEYNRISSLEEFSVPLTIGFSYIGGAHSHPDDGYAMFSFADVKFLNDAYNEASPTRKEDVFLMVIAKDNAGHVNTYGIRVDNIDVLNTKVSGVWNDPRYNRNNPTDDKKLEKIHYDQSIEYDKSNGALEESFLKQFGSFGLTLYKADDSLTKWDKLEIDKTTKKATTVPCT